MKIPSRTKVTAVQSLTFVSKSKNMRPRGKMFSFSKKKKFSIQMNRSQPIFMVETANLVLRYLIMFKENAFRGFSIFIPSFEKN